MVVVVGHLSSQSQDVTVLAYQSVRSSQQVLTASSVLNKATADVADVQLHLQILRKWNGCMDR